MMDFSFRYPKNFSAPNDSNNSAKKFSAQKKIFNRSRTCYFSQKLGLKEVKMQKKKIREIRIW